MGSGQARTPLYPADRLDKAAAAAAGAGLGALLLTPGSDLRYVTGYDAPQLERLTCLVLSAMRPPFMVVPRLELPAALASPAGHIGLDIIGWDETDDPYALVAGRLGAVTSVGLAGRLGGVSSVGLGARWWALLPLRLRAALPAPRRGLASEALRGLRIRKSP